MPLTEDQIKLANSRSAMPDSADGRVPDVVQTPQNKPTIKRVEANKPITSMEELPKAGDETNETGDETVVEEKPVNFNDFLEASATDKTPLVDKTVKTSSDVKPKLETGLDEVPPVDEEELPAAPIVKPTLKEFKQSKDKADLPARDVAGLPDDLVEHFKNEMSRPAFDKIKPLVVEHKALKEQNAELTDKLDKYAKGGLPESYYEHPNAFLLTPQYGQQLQVVSDAQSIVNHWEQQLERVNEGSAEFDTLVHDANGQLVTQTIKAPANAKFLIEGAIRNTTRQLIQQQSNLDTIAAVHKEKHSQAASWVQQHDNQVYAYFNSEGGKQLLPHVQNVLKGFHPSVQSNPLAGSLAKADYIIGMLATMIQNMQKDKVAPAATTNKAAPKNRQQTLSARQRMAGPTNGDAGGHNGSDETPGKEEVSIDAFNRVKDGY